MSEKDRKKLRHEDAVSLLPESDFVHIFHESGDVQGVYWKKDRVVQHMLENGCELAGDEARKIRHGLCSNGGKGWIFIETKQPPKV